MRVRVTLSLDVDPERWMYLYGLTPNEARWRVSAADVRRDVRDYAYQAIAMSPAMETGAIRSIDRS